MWNDLHLPPCFITFNDDSTVSYGLNNQSDRFRKKNPDKDSENEWNIRAIIGGFCGNGMHQLMQSKKKE